MKKLAFQETAQEILILAGSTIVARTGRLDRPGEAMTIAFHHENSQGALNE